MNSDRWLFFGITAAILAFLAAVIMVGATGGFDQPHHAHHSHHLTVPAQNVKAGYTMGIDGGVYSCHKVG